MTTTAASPATVPVFVPPLPDPATALRAWSELQAQSGEQTTRAAREAICAAMQLAEQGATTTREWLQAASTSAAQLSRIAHAAAGRAGEAPDVGALWEAEVDWINQAAQAATGSMQQAWTALVDNQSHLAEALLGEGNRGFHRWLEMLQANGAARQARLDPAAETPVVTGENLWFDWMGQALRATQAFWQEASAAIAPATEAAASAGEGNGSAGEPAVKGRRGASRKH
jgi:hypothetical protein